MYYYAVNKGHIPGIYNSWEECKTQINKFSGALFKKFDKYDDAVQFYKNGANSNTRDKSTIKIKDIYNDNKSIYDCRP